MSGTHTHTCTHTHMHTHTHTHMHTHTCTHTHLHAPTQVSVCMCVCVCVSAVNDVWGEAEPYEMWVQGVLIIPHHTHNTLTHICTLAYMCVYMNTYTPTHTPTNTCTHTHAPHVLGIRSVLSSGRHLGWTECPECLGRSL